MGAEIAAATGQHLTRKKSRKALSPLRWPTWPMRSRKSRSQRGHDVTRYTLACFGGAGGQHACLVADALGMDRYDPPAGAAYCRPMAWALPTGGPSGSKAMAARCDAEALAPRIRTLTAEAEADLRAQGVDGEILGEVAVHIRYEGTDSSIEVPYGDVLAMQAAFEGRHFRQFGFVSAAPLVVEMIRAEAVFRSPDETGLTFALPPKSGPPQAHISCFMAGAAHDTPLYNRSELAAGFSGAGSGNHGRPRVHNRGRTGLDGGGRSHRQSDDDAQPRPSAAGTIGTEVDPMRLEILAGCSWPLPRRWARRCQRSASSVNIRERLDFSCAVFDGAAAIWWPMPRICPCTSDRWAKASRTILKRGQRPDGRGIRAGDVYVLNAPYAGGTHLPDITVIMPVFVDATAAAYFVAARGHHADIGGITPGSMPPDSRRSR